MRPLGTWFAGRRPARRDEVDRLALYRAFHCSRSSWSDAFGRRGIAGSRSWAPLTLEVTSTRQTSLTRRRWPRRDARWLVLASTPRRSLPQVLPPVLRFHTCRGPVVAVRVVAPVGELDADGLGPVPGQPGPLVREAGAWRSSSPGPRALGRGMAIESPPLQSSGGGVATGQNGTTRRQRSWSTGSGPKMGGRRGVPVMTESTASEPGPGPGRRGRRSARSGRAIPAP